MSNTQQPKDETPRKGDVQGNARAADPMAGDTVTFGRAGRAGSDSNRQ